MKKILLLFILVLSMAGELQAQFTRYLVKLTNKNGTPFTLTSPNAFLSQRAVDRRTRFGIAYDSTDLPVTPSYVTQIDNVPNVTILNVSKWLNSVSIQTPDPGAITTISAFPFVQSVSGLAARQGEIITPVTRDKFAIEEMVTALPWQREARVAADYFNYGTNAYNEIHLHNGEFLHNIGLRGQGMHIAMLDAGFFNYTTLDAFDSAMANGQVLTTWDFVARHASVVEDNSHGMMCFSTIAANIPGQFVGKAPKASFHLFRTEDVASEYPIEEHNWVCGAERADSAGSDIISSSLGYFDFDNSTFNYTYANMNGNTTISAVGADLAAKKGLLVFNAVGNEGNTAWHFLITPSDGDSVVAVGAVNSNGVVGSISSYGPSSDGQIKPNVASVGISAVVQLTNNTIGTSSGTSFACPNMAGLATCLWQGFPEYNNMRILRALHEAGSIYSAPNDRIGYGIPNMKAAFTSLLMEYATASASINACTVTVNWTSKDVFAMKYEIERKTPTETNFVKIGETASQAGQVLGIHSYQFQNTLVNVPNGTVSYRIRQIIDTATTTFAATYLDTVNVNCPGCYATGLVNPDPNKEFIVVYPNPTSSRSTLLIETTYAVPDMTIQVYDMKGGRVIQMQQSKGTGRVLVELPVDKLPKGKYIIKIYNREKTIGTAELMRQ